MLASCSAVGGARGGAWSCDCVALVDSISGREATFNTKQSQLTTHITCSVLKHEFQFGPHSLCRSLKKWHKVCITQWSQYVHIRHTMSLYPGISFDQSLQFIATVHSINTCNRYYTCGHISQGEWNILTSRILTSVSRSHRVVPSLSFSFSSLQCQTLTKSVCCKNTFC